MEAADFFVGAAIASLVRVPLYPRNSRESHLHMLGHTGCRALVVGEKYLPEVESLQRDLPDLAQPLQISGEDLATSSSVRSRPGTIRPS